jgi:hypothetical protein
MSAQTETWRVSTVEGVFETDLETLKQWILEGCVLPTDKVSKGTLSWIDAGRVPKLRGAFAGEVSTEVPPSLEVAEQPIEHNHTPPVSTYTPAARCHNHPDVAPDYICRVCNATLCKQCPRFVGTSGVPLCSLCGDLCRPYDEVKQRAARSSFQSSGFGMSDLGRAISYPLQHKTALIGGAILYGFCLLAGFWGYLFGVMVLFGCVSRAISQVAWGRFKRSFMPDFSEFNILDDIVVPLFLGLGITIVSWGPTIALVLALVFGVLSGAAGPTGPLGPTAPAETAGPTSEDLDTLLDPNADPHKLAAANEKLNEAHPGAVIAREAEKSKAEQNDPAAMAKKLMPYLGAGLLILVLFLLCLAWGVFYYPMALAVAGYTQSVAAVLNPLVGLDTIRRMGATYFKAFGMVIVVQIVATVVSVIVAAVMSPFNLPFFGNLPASFINGMFTFYFNLVIACVLGLALFKNADRLGIEVD